MVVFSEQAYKREENTFRKQLNQYREQAQKQLRHLSHQEFKREEEANAAIATLEKKWPFHQAEVKIDAVVYYGHRGRPQRGEEPKEVRWGMKGKVMEKIEAISQALKQKGKFILATNEKDTERLSTKTMLSVYKGQRKAVERGFRFLKNLLFFAHSLFLKRPERVMALLIVIGLALLVYALAEHTVRTELVRRKESIHNQVGKPTQQPTIRRIFQVFEGIDVLLVSSLTGIPRLVLNLKPIHRQILDLLGPEVQKGYFLDG